MLPIQRIIDRNIAMGNKQGEFNGDLERRLIMEESLETMNAIDQKDEVEIVDWCIDTIFVMIGTLHKLGLAIEQIEECFDEVVDSNFSKFPMVKDANGKITKWPNFFRPKLNRIINPEFGNI